MAHHEDEEKLLRSVALQNAQSILLARQRAEQDLLEAKETLELRTEELARSLAMLRATLEAATDGFLVTDSPGKVTGFNERFVEMWRMPREVMDSGEHRRLIEVISRQFEDPEGFRARIDEIYASSHADSYDLLELADGRVYERFSRIQFINGRNAGRVWSFRDITERRRSEAALEAQSELLRITLSSIGDAVITTDAEGRVTFLNGVAESLCGWTQGDARGRPLEEVFQVVSHRTRQPVENPALRALREGRIVGLANHSVLIARDGTERPIDDSAAPIVDRSGATVGSVLVFRDVTERMQAEMAQARLAAIVESSQDAIVSKTLDGIIRSWNAEAERLFGWTAEEAVGQPITLIIPPERQDEERHIIERLRQGERVEHFETVRVTKDGRRINLSLMISPVRDSSGDIIGASKIARDITDRQRAEEALREADRQKDDFLALLAHELRNPLAPLRNGLQIIRLAGDDAEAVGKARTMMERQLGHMIRLVDDLLDISRISRNKMELRRSRVLLADVVSSAVETARPAIDAAGAGPSRRRPHPAGSGVQQPAHQQRPLHRARRPHLADCRAARGRGGRLGAGYGNRHPHRRPAPHLRDVLPGGPEHGALDRRPGHRARARQGPGRDAWWGRHRRERRAGEGQHVHRPAPRPGGAAGAAGSGNARRRGRPAAPETPHPGGRRQPRLGHLDGHGPAAAGQ
jgi:PAS domain S-box-containing protein